MKKFMQAHAKLIIGILLLLVLVFAWLWFAGNARQQTSFRRTSERVSQVRDLAKKSYAGTRTNRVAALTKLAGLPQDNLCRGDWWNDWQQTLVPTIKNDAQACKAKEEKLVKVIRAASETNRYLTDEAKIAKHLQLLIVDNAALGWPTKAKKAAESALSNVNGIRVVSAVKPVQTAAKTRIEAIISAWNALHTASDKNDKTAYLSAEATLEQAYADLAAIADVSDTALSKQLNLYLRATTAI